MYWFPIRAGWRIGFGLIIPARSLTNRCRSVRGELVPATRVMERLAAVVIHEPGGVPIEFSGL